MVDGGTLWVVYVGVGHVFLSNVGVVYLGG